MNRSSLRSEIEYRTGLYEIDDNIDNWLDWGLYLIDRKCDLKGLRKHVRFSLTAYQSEYAFPTDLKYVKQLKILDHLMEDVDQSDVATATGYITVSVDIDTGTRIMFLSSDPPAPLSSGTTYYAINVDSTHIQLATSESNAEDGTAITLTDTGSDNQVMEIFNGEDSRKLIYVPEKAFDSNVPDITELTAGKTDFYIDFGDFFQLGKEPSEALCGDLSYIKWQDNFADDDDTPEVSHADDLIVAAGMIYAWIANEQEGKIQFAKDHFDDLLKGHEKVENIRPDWFPVGQEFGSGKDAVRHNISANAYKYPFRSNSR